MVRLVPIRSREGARTGGFSLHGEDWLPYAHGLGHLDSSMQDVSSELLESTIEGLECYLGMPRQLPDQLQRVQLRG